MISDLSRSISGRSSGSVDAPSTTSRLRSVWLATWPSESPVTSASHCSRRASASATRTISRRPASTCSRPAPEVASSRCVIPNGTTNRRERPWKRFSWATSAYALYADSGPVSGWPLKWTKSQRSPRSSSGRRRPGSRSRRRAAPSRARSCRPEGRPLPRSRSTETNSSRAYASTCSSTVGVRQIDAASELLVDDRADLARDSPSRRRGSSSRAGAPGPRTSPVRGPAAARRPRSRAGRPRARSGAPAGRRSGREAPARPRVASPSPSGDGSDQERGSAAVKLDLTGCVASRGAGCARARRRKLERRRPLSASSPNISSAHGVPRAGTAAARRRAAAVSETLAVMPDRRSG